MKKILAGAFLLFVGLFSLACSGSGVSTISSYNPAAVAITGGSAYGVLVKKTILNTSSGTEFTILGFPAGVHRITILVNGISLVDGAIPIIRIGCGSVDSTGYFSANTGLANTTAFTTTSTVAFPLTSASGSISTHTGTMTLINVDANIWLANSMISNGVAANDISSGVKTLSCTLDRIQLTTVTGTSTFDGGSINIMYE